MAHPHDLRYIKPISVLPCSNVDVSLSWYTRLGFKLGGKHTGFLSLMAGEKACCNLYLRERQSSSFELGTGEVIILLETGEASKLFQHAQAIPDLTYAPHGGEVCEPKPWGFCQFSVLDPDGNKITFASHLTDDDEEPEVQAPSVPDL